MSTVQHPSPANNHDLISENPSLESPSIVSERTENQEPSISSARATFNETGEIIRVSLAKIILDPRLQMRADIRDGVVAEYAESVFDLPPGMVIRSEDGTMWLTDGWYRFHAHAQAGLKDMPCHVRDGTYLDALLEAAAANPAHGVQRTADDKRRAVMALLAEPQLADWSDRRIAEHCHVGHRFVGVVRKEWEAQQEEDDGTEDPGGSGATSENTEEPKRTGRDGKRHPAKRKKTDDEPILCDRCKRVGAVKDCPQCMDLVKADRADRKKKKKADPKDAAEVVVDAFQNEVPARLRKMYRDPWLQETIDFLAEAEAAIRNECLADGMDKRARHFPFINSKDTIYGIAMVMNTMEQVLDHLKENRPAGVCPMCAGDGCAKCKNAGMVPRAIFEKLVEPVK